MAQNPTDSVGLGQRLDHAQAFGRVQLGTPKDLRQPKLEHLRSAQLLD